MVPLALPFPFAVTLTRVSLPLTVLGVVWQWGLCVLDTEILVLAPSPKSFHLVIVVWVTIWVTITWIPELYFSRISDFPRDPIAVLPEEIIFFVEVSVIFAYGNRKTLLLKIWFLLFADRSFLQYLLCMSKASFPGTLHRRI